MSHRLTWLLQGLGRDRKVDHLALARLTLEAVTQVARSLVGEGNPFILTEAVISLNEAVCCGAMRTGARSGPAVRRRGSFQRVCGTLFCSAWGG